MTNEPFWILAYHRLGKTTSPDGWTVAKSDFTDQMRFLLRRFRPVSLGDLVEAMIARRPIPPRAVAVTFDDGYADTCTLALPILKRMKIPATVFITTAYMDGSAAPSRAPMLSWRRVREMQKAGIEIGSHTLTHPHLPRLSRKEAGRQILVSRRRIEEMLQVPVRLFAYPYGEAGTAKGPLRTSVRSAGYLAACTTRPGHNHADTDRYALSRVPPLSPKLEPGHFTHELSRLARGKTGRRAAKGIYNFTDRTVRLWKKRYGRLDRAIERRGFFDWKMP